MKFMGYLDSHLGAASAASNSAVWTQSGNLGCAAWGQGGMGSLAADAWRASGAQ